MTTNAYSMFQNKIFQNTGFPKLSKGLDLNLYISLILYPELSTWP